jgi:DNA invertase Pin-like site-specific DNA recombinase
LFQHGVVALLGFGRWDVSDGLQEPSVVKPIDTTTPSGRAMFQMCGVFAEFERAMIVERVNSGLAKAKAKGVKLGRGNKKDGERTADETRWGMSRSELEKRILRVYKGGMGMVKRVRRK